MDIRTRVQMELVGRQLAVGAAMKRLQKEEREAKKDSRPLPASRRDSLDADVFAARLAVRSAEASLAGVSKYPPLSRYS